MGIKVYYNKNDHHKTIILKMQVDDIYENLPRYYVDMLQIHVVTNLKTAIVWQQIWFLTINNTTLEVEVDYRNLKHLT
jgi:hypothetical protein